MDKYNLQALRQKMKEKGSFTKDQNQFIPPKLQEGEKSKIYRFYILPPLQEGDKVTGGIASRSMELFYVPNGNHWHNRRPIPCPRIHDEADCPWCSLAFEMMGETDDKAQRRNIAKNHLPQQRFAVNIYFPNIDTTPTDLRGKIMWFNAPKQVYDIWEACVMRDDEGDPADPQAFGAFFNEESAYLFQLEIVSQGEYNEYKTSKFLTNLGKNPIARTKKDGQVVADAVRIQQILESRHDIYTKFEDRDVEKIRKIVAAVVNKDPDGVGTGGGDAGFDEDETKKPATKSEQRTDKKAEVVTEEVQLGDLGGEVAAEPKTKVEKPQAKTEKLKESINDDELNSLISDINNA